MRGGPIATGAYLGALAAGANEDAQSLVTALGAAADGAITGLGAFGARASEPSLQPSRTFRGVRRDAGAYWRSTRDLWDQLGYGNLLSEANRAAIGRGRSPVVDEAWVRVFPEDEGLMGEQIEVHHVGGNALQIPLPASRHRDAHMPGGPKTNRGGPGGGLPVYRPDSDDR